MLATIALFTGLLIWNEWYNCMLFISDQKLYTLQYYLYNMLNNAAAMKELVSGTSVDLSSGAELPAESAKLAMAIIATGPILLLYPFIQKYFVKRYCNRRGKGIISRKKIIRTRLKRHNFGIFWLCHLCKASAFVASSAPEICSKFYSFSGRRIFERADF
ncbi:MAG: hypothetical protein L6V93_17070 [Clostridiales bacterium]|nr:MAG: hypothetical protein L6V93_17070 [Clostridiales bacterium]